jgi:hypothetical protein
MLVQGQPGYFVLILTLNSMMMSSQIVGVDYILAGLVGFV